MSCHVMSCHVSVLEKMIEHQSSLIANLMRPRAEEKVETGVQACMTIPRKIDDRSFANVNLRWPQNHHRFHVMSCIGPRNDDRASIVFDRELDAAARGRERRDWGTSPQVCRFPAKSTIVASRTWSVNLRWPQNHHRFRKHQPRTVRLLYCGKAENNNEADDGSRTH